MLTITYRNIDTKAVETANFLDLETFQAMGERVDVVQWEHFNKDGKSTAGGSGINAYPELIEAVELYGLQ